MSAAMKIMNSRECSNRGCNKGEDGAWHTDDEKNPAVKLRSCAKCKELQNPHPSMYCSVSCQKEDWPFHKGKCDGGTLPESVVSGNWHDKYRACMDKGFHFGKLELITWEAFDEDFGEWVGWGGIRTANGESAAFRRKFEKKFNCDEERLCKYREQSFRWTCCGMDVMEGSRGCDHHGQEEAPHPCSCDFCRAGQPLPLKEFEKKIQSRVGLTNLTRGPDTRARSSVGVLNLAMRRMFMGDS